MNDKDSKLLWEAYNNVCDEPINELNIPAPNDERSAANFPEWPEFIAKVKELRDKMIDAQTNLPIGLGQHMSEDVIRMFTSLTPKNLYWLFKEFLKAATGDKDNVFSNIVREVEEKERAAKQ